MKRRSFFGAIAAACLAPFVKSKPACGACVDLIPNHIDFIIGGVDDPPAYMFVTSDMRHWSRVEVHHCPDK